MCEMGYVLSWACICIVGILQLRMGDAGMKEV